jgi:hypothetical protein
MYFIYFTILLFELWASHLLGICPNTWTILPALFALVIVEIRSAFLPRLVSTRILLFYVSCHSLDDKYVTTYPTFTTFFPLRWCLINNHFWIGLEPQSFWFSIPCSLGWQMHATVLSYWLRWSLANSLLGLALDNNTFFPQLPSS